MEPSLEDRLAVASALILQSPPGEVNDVFNDLRPVVGDDSELESGLLPALSQYNTEQLMLVELPNAKMPAMICSAARLDPLSSGETYLDPNSQQTFTFDHLRLTASDVAKYTTDGDELSEKLRSELNFEAGEYVQSHYQNAFWSVFIVPSQNPANPCPDDDHSTKQVHAETAVESVTNQPEEPKDNPVDEESTTANTPEQMTEVTSDDHQPSDSPQQPDQSINEVKPAKKKFQLYIVGNKYNPSNYWTGRWRSSYEIDMDSGQIRGHIQVNVHYYEQGNVQLSTDYEPIIDLPPVESLAARKPSQVLKAIEKMERIYQNSLNSAYADLGDQTFKQLRRALPVTKQKINWNNIKSRIVLNDN